MCGRKKWSHYQKKVGYIRIDCQKAVDILNEYYGALCLFQNHFITVRKTKDKVRIGSRYQRTYEPAKTPYQRIIEADEISDTQKKELEKSHQSLNMFELQKKMTELLEKVWTIQKEKRGKLY